jgi:ABC-type transport system involved in multi-copper enzyme maturation permease subunit
LLLITTMDGPDPVLQAQENRDTALSFLSLSAMLLAILVAATELPRDLSMRVLPLVLSKPLARHQLVLGKFFGVLFFVGAFFLGGLAIAAASLWAQGLPPDGMFARMALQTLLRLGIFVVVAILFSTSLGEMPCIVFSTAYLALGYCVVIAGPMVRTLPVPTAVKGMASGLLYAVPNLTDLSPPRTWLSDWVEGLITPESEAYARTLTFALDAVVGGGTVPTWGELGAAMLYTLFYGCLILAAAVLSFRRLPVD